MAGNPAATHLDRATSRRRTTCSERMFWICWLAGYEGRRWTGFRSKKLRGLFASSSVPTSSHRSPMRRSGSQSPHPVNCQSTASGIPRPSEPAAGTYGVVSPSPKRQTSLSRDARTISMMSVMRWSDFLDWHPAGDSCCPETTLMSGLTPPYWRSERTTPPMLTLAHRIAQRSCELGRFALRFL